MPAKRVTSLAGGLYHTIALRDDGTLAAWGRGASGVLGSGFTLDGTGSVPVAIPALKDGETFSKLPSGSLSTQAIVTASCPVSSDANLSGLSFSPGHLFPTLSPGISHYEVRAPARNDTFIVTPTVANAHATVTVNGSVVASGTASSPINRRTGQNLVSIIVTAQDGSTKSYSLTAVDDSCLAGLTINTGVLSPAFSPDRTDYAEDVPATATTVRLTPRARDSSSSITVNGTAIASGSVSGLISLSPGVNEIPVKVMTLDGAGSTTYLVSVIRLEPLHVTLDSSTTIPVTATGYTAGGNTVHLSLGHAPATGTHFKLIDNTGFDLIRGRFSNLAHGQVVVLPFGNANYKFAANYFGGDGNDLVLQWAGTKAYAWGSGGAGELGTGGTAWAPTPVLVTHNGILSGKAVVSIAAGGVFSLAQCSDGTLAAWGSNYTGQLGNGSLTNSKLPIAVTSTDALAGRKPAAIQTNSVSYTPPAGFSGTDTFPLTIRDSRGATVTGTVTIAVRSASAPFSGGVGVNPPVVTLLPDGKPEVSFQGIPGQTYQVQRATAGLTHWTTVATLTADSVGRISFTDNAPPPDSAFYRISSP